MNLIADIRRIMLEKGIAQAELARTLGMSASQLSSILRDEDYNFTVKMLRRFAAALDTELSITIGEWAPLEVEPTYTIKPGVFTYPSTAANITITRGDVTITRGE